MGGQTKLAAALIVALALSGCGGGSGAEESSDAGGRRSTTTTTGRTGTDEAPGDASKQDSSGDKGEQVADPTQTTQTTRGGTASSTPPTTEPKKPAPVEATLEQSCIKAGGRQSITIKALPQSAVVYDSYYADGKSGMSEGFYGGNNGAVAESGTWSDTWVVSPHAPPGQVRVIVRVASYKHSSSTTDLYYDLVPPTGTCPAS